MGDAANREQSLRQQLMVTEEKLKEESEAAYWQRVAASDGAIHVLEANETLLKEQLKDAAKEEEVYWQKFAASEAALKKDLMASEAALRKELMVVVRLQANESLLKEKLSDATKREMALKLQFAAIKETVHV